MDITLGGCSVNKAACCAVFFLFLVPSNEAKFQQTGALSIGTEIGASTAHIEPVARLHLHFKKVAMLSAWFKWKKSATSNGSRESGSAGNPTLGEADGSLARPGRFLKGGGMKVDHIPWLKRPLQAVMAA
jgi:hypothetical protein